MAERPRVYIEPWPTGGWAVWLEGLPSPVSRHDTEQEARFRAAAYREGIARGQRLAFGQEHANAPGGQR